MSEWETEDYLQTLELCFSPSLLKRLPWVSDITLSPETGEGASFCKGTLNILQMGVSMETAKHFCKRQPRGDRTHASKCVHGNSRYWGGGRGGGRGRKRRAKDLDVSGQNCNQPFSKGCILDMIQLDRLHYKGKRTFPRRHILYLQACHFIFERTDYFLMATARREQFYEAACSHEFLCCKHCTCLYSGWTLAASTVPRRKT